MKAKIATQNKQKNVTKTMIMLIQKAAFSQLRKILFVPPPV